MRQYTHKNCPIEGKDCITILEEKSNSIPVHVYHIITCDFVTLSSKLLFPLYQALFEM